MSSVRVAAIQHDIVWEDKDANFARLAPMVAAAAGAGARLAVLTETFSTGFSNHIDTVAEPEGGPSSQFLAAMAAEHGLWVAGSCPETRGEDPKPYNTLVLAGPDGTQHRYRKIHPFTFSGEDRYFSAGDELVTVEVEGLRVSLFVCYDLRFADEFWPLAPETDCYVVPANWPRSRRSHWSALLRARAIENQAYVVGVNRVGEGGALTYAGDSVIVDPLGDVVADAGDAECVVTAAVDPARVEALRTRFPFLADRR